MLFLLLAGCGTTSVRTLPSRYKTVFIPVANNSTLEYGAEERVTDILVREFQRDGRLQQVSNWQDADIILESNITRYDLIPVTLDNDNRRAGSRLDLTIKVTARDRQTGVFVMSEQEFSESGVFFLAGVPGERREEDIVRRVAKLIIAALLEGWG